jgi:hypothetical protein
LPLALDVDLRLDDDCSTDIVVGDGVEGGGGDGDADHAGTFRSGAWIAAAISSSFRIIAAMAPS